MFFIGLLCIIVYLTYRYLYPKNVHYPPGPLGIPIFGFFPFLRRDAHKQFYEMTNEYGNLISLKLGPKNILVLNDWVTVKEALLEQGQIFSGRPKIFLYQQAVKDKDVSTSDGPVTVLQREFTLNILKNIQVEKGVECVAIEISHLINELNKNPGQPTPMEDIFFMAVLNVTWCLLGGERYPYDDKYVCEFKDAINSNYENFSNLNLLNVYPVLRFLYLNKTYQQFMKNHRTICSFLQNSVNDHINRFHAESKRDFIDMYLNEIILKNEDECKGQETHPFTETRLLATLYNLFHGGIHTTSNLLSWGILYMVVWPEIQEKVQNEIDKEIGKSRFPSIDDRDKLPYTEAVILEIHRYASVGPLSVPHRTTTDTKLMGYDVSKNTEVYPNIWAVHHDRKVWGDPEVFRPERFLGSDGKVQIPEYLIPFSLGPRNCIGNHIAKLIIFVFFTSLLQKFQLKIPFGVPPPSIEPIVGLTLRPQPFKALLIRKSVLTE